MGHLPRLLPREVRDEPLRTLPLLEEKVDFLANELRFVGVWLARLRLDEPTLRFE